MKTSKTILKLAFIGLLASTMACDNQFSNAPDEENIDVASELAKTSTLDYEVASAEAAGLNSLSDKDAIFSLGFSEYYDPIEETVKDRSDAFAAAPDSDSFRGMRSHAGKDMGTVTLTYNGTTDLEVTWQGSEDSQKLVLALAPILDRSDFQGPGARFHADEQNSNGPFGGPHRGPGRQFGRHGMQPGKFHDLHLRFVIEENNGSYTIPADAIAQVLTIEGVNGMALKVMQLLASEIDENEATYALIMRQGDLVKLDIVSE